MAGVVLLVASLGAAGWPQGQALLDPKISYPEIAAATRPWLLGASAAQALLLLGTSMLGVNFALTLSSSLLASTAPAYAPPAKLAASVS